MINSTSNKQIKNLIQLQKKGKSRREQDIFVVEGIKMYLEAPKERILMTYVSKSFYEKEENRKLLDEDKLEIVEDRVFQTASETQTPQGILCLLRQYHYELKDAMKQEAPNLLILESLQDPGNLGTILRTAEGAGVSGILMTRDTVDIYNPKTIRSTMGSIYRIPFLYTDHMKDMIEEVKKSGITVFAAHLKGAKEYYLEDYRKPTAFLIGNEGNGLSEELARTADHYIKIPMSGKVESLNAAVASSVLMYEARRQRS